MGDPTIIGHLGWGFIVLYSKLCAEIALRVPIAYRIYGIVLLFVFFWGLNISGFEAYNVNFRGALGLKTGDAQAKDVFEGVSVLVLVVVPCFWIRTISLDSESASGVTASYVLLVSTTLWLLLYSSRTFFRDSRHFLKKRFVNIVSAGDVHFIDVLFADALTSLSKVMADCQLLVCASLAFALADDTIGPKCGFRLIAPMLQSVPYAIRAFQCYLTYDRKDDRMQLVNLGKYLSSFPVIWSSALKHDLNPVEGVALTQHDQYLEMLWWYTVILNTLYSFLWDVYKDWGMGYPRDPKGRSQYLFLRPQLDYRRPWLYYFVVVQNLLLRACWSLKLSSHLQEYATGAAVVIMFEIFEVYRRWAWIYGRVEWECIDKNIPKGSPQPLGISGAKDIQTV